MAFPYPAVKKSVAAAAKAKGKAKGKAKAKAKVKAKGSPIAMKMGAQMMQAGC